MHSFRWFRQLWDLLPDNCQMPNCCRQGTRGNENVVNGVIVCDYCDAAHA